jgi:hypothetical protein
MATITKQFLSGSTNGRGIKVTGVNAGAAVTIHAADADDKDEVHLWAFNTDSSDRVLTIEFGGTTDPDDLVEFTVPATDGSHLVIPGWVISGGLNVKAFAAVANVIVIHGFVNRIT